LMLVKNVLRAEGVIDGEMAIGWTVVVDHEVPVVVRKGGRGAGKEQWRVLLIKMEEKK
jgi:hypothetical protein